MAGGGPIAPYSAPVGLVYVFNLIIGTGALALPRAVQDAGWLLGAALLCVSALTSYVNATFVTEAMAAANGMIMTRRMRRVKQMAVIAQTEPHSSMDNPSYTNTEDMSAVEVSTPTAAGHLPRRATDIALSLQPKDEYFEIIERTELSQMARMFLNKYGVLAFCIILAVYLFGDLAIYGAVVPKSVMNMVCAGSPCINATDDINDADTLCRDEWPSDFTRLNVYRILVLVFAVVVGPFVYVGMTKTKYLQILTTAARWIAMTMMIALASYSLATEGPRGKPPLVNMDNFAKLFGITVYAFMCQHSLPAIVTPMMRKERLYWLLSVVYALVLLVYATLSLTGAFAFSNKRFNDVYTLNFINSCDGGPSHWYTLVMDYFLAMFPVFTISMNFPIVGVTLSNNLRSMALGMADSEKYGNATGANERAPSRTGSVPNLLADDNIRARLLVHSSDDESSGERGRPSGQSVTSTANYSTGSRTPHREDPSTGLGCMERFLSRCLIPTAVVILPLGIALYSDDVETLASYVAPQIALTFNQGSYAGVGVQFVIPSMLVIAARRACSEKLALNHVPRHASPFRNVLWPYFMFVWSVICVGIVTFNNVWG